MVAQDFLLNQITGDLLIVNGDFSIGASDEQHIQDIIIAIPGDWKEYPLLGAAIQTYINGSDLYELSQNIKIQLGGDGYNTSDINITYNQSNSQYNVAVNATRTNL